MLTQAGKIGFSDEQAQLLDIAENFCKDKSPVTRVRALLEDETGFDAALWREMADLGWLGIAVPEAHGGIGLSLAEAVTVAEPMGRALMATPFLSTTLAAQVLLVAGTDSQKADLLPNLASGSIATVATSEAHGDWALGSVTVEARSSGSGLVLSGEKRLVLDAAQAEVLIVSVRHSGQPAWVLLEAGDIPPGALRRETVVDETRRSFSLNLDGITVPAERLLDAGKAHAAMARLELAANLLLAADMCGGTAGVIDYTLDYLRTRKQFGRTIGSYQALKHPMAEALIAFETARSHLYHAAFIFEEGEAGEAAVRMAKSAACEAYAFAADRAIQFHGGFGFTYDCDAQLYRRRALWDEYQYGDGRYHRRKLADLLLHT